MNRKYINIPKKKLFPVQVGGTNYLYLLQMSAAGTCWGALGSPGQLQIWLIPRSAMDCGAKEEEKGQRNTKRTWEQLQKSVILPATFKVWR